MATASYYTPDRIDWLLRNFAAVRAYAETPRTARQLLDPYRPGPTPTNPRSARQRGHHADPMRGADLVADIERAHQGLPAGLGRDVVYWRQWGYSLGAIAEGLHHSKRDVVAANQGALRCMAVTLGWVDPDESAAAQLQDAAGDAPTSVL